MASAAIERSCRIETVPHLTTRDWTIMGLESVLFGAHAEGRAEHPRRHGRSARGWRLPGLPRRIRARLDRAHGAHRPPEQGRGLQRAADRRARAPRSTLAWPSTRLPTISSSSSTASCRKIAAGAAFAMTQLVFDLDTFDHFRHRLGGSSPLPLLLGVCRSGAAARPPLPQRAPGIVVPQQLQDALRDAGADAADVGMAHREEARARRGARPRVTRGRRLVVPYRKPLRVLELLED